jgi:hypothetical protein
MLRNTRGPLKFRACLALGRMVQIGKVEQTGYAEPDQSVFRGPPARQLHGYSTTNQQKQEIWLPTSTTFHITHAQADSAYLGSSST